MAAIFDFNGSGRLGKGINLYQGGGRRSKIRRGVGVGEDYGFFSPLPRPLPPPFTLTANQNLAGRANDRELSALARTNKTPALRANQTLNKLDFRDRRLRIVSMEIFS